MGWADSIIERLKLGEAVSCRPKGNSMVPIINSGDLCTIVPLSSSIKLKVKDIVLCRVKGRQYLHLITSIKDDRYLISNNKKHDNGWIGRKDIFGILEKVE